MSCGIYAVSNNETGKCIYVGKSESIEKRWFQHLNPDQFGKMQDIDKLLLDEGCENFNFRILEICSKTALPEKEAYWLEKKGTLLSAVGVNKVKAAQPKKTYNEQMLLFVDEMASSILTIAKTTRHSKSHLTKWGYIKEEWAKDVFEDAAIKWCEENNRDIDKFAFNAKLRNLVIRRIKTFPVITTSVEYVLSLKHKMAENTFTIEDLCYLKTFFPELDKYWSKNTTASVLQGVEEILNV
jgi:group I intron endonuclease